MQTRLIMELYTGSVTIRGCFSPPIYMSLTYSTQKDTLLYVCEELLGLRKISYCNIDATDGAAR